MSIYPLQSVDSYGGRYRGSRGVYGGGGDFMSSSQVFTSPGFGQSPSTDRRVCGGGERRVCV